MGPTSSQARKAKRALWAVEAVQDHILDTDWKAHRAALLAFQSADPRLADHPEEAAELALAVKAIDYFISVGERISAMALQQQGN